MIDGVHIWRAALDEAGWPGAERLPPREQARAASFLREDARRRWTASRWALRRVLAEHLDEPAAAIEFELGERGKPRLRGDGPLRFNLSHSGGLVLVAVTVGREVGVDVELIERGRDLPALAERALSAEAAAAIRDAAPADRPSLFYAAWTRHEARLKCLGLGLGMSTSRRFGPPQGQNRRFGEISVENLDISPGYAAAVAVQAAEVGPIECRSLRAG